VDVVAKTIEKYHVSAVIDMAGSIEVAESVKNPLKYYDNNFGRKLRFLQCLKQHQVKAVVFSSTAAVYGEPVSVPIREDHPKAPKNPYGWSKLNYEQMLGDFHHSGGPAWMALRYFNAAGASFDGDIGESHEPESHLIPLACYAALGVSPALEIYGNDYPTSDGTAIRDYIHVLDLASAHVLAVRHLLEGGESGAFNLGNGIGTSIGDVMACFEKLGIHVPHRFRARRPGDPARLVANADAARKLLGWKPDYADIQSIVRSAYQWHQATAISRQELA
jgi:UDP-glucose 4-epimerase